MVLDSESEGVIAQFHLLDDVITGTPGLYFETGWTISTDTSVERSRGRDHAAQPTTTMRKSSSRIPKLRLIQDTRPVDSRRRFLLGSLNRALRCSQ